jgi:predicted nuclease with TOPRIM domain
MPWEGWKLDRHIPIALVFAMFVQTITIVWWFSGWTATIEERLKGLENDSRNNNQKTIIREERIRDLENNVNRMDERLKGIDNTTKRIERKLDKLTQNWQQRADKAQYFAMTLEQLSRVTI